MALLRHRNMRSRHPMRALVTFVAACAACVGCNEIAGIHAPLEAVDLTPFVGQWTSSGLQYFTSCTDPVFNSSSPTPTLDVTIDGTELLFSFAGCTLRATVAGETATIEPDQQCNFDSGGPFIIRYSNDSTFTLLSNGTAQLDSSGVSDDGTASCNFATNNTYQKTQP